MSKHIVHPIQPVYNQYSRILILGSFPSPKSREEGFFYGNPQNRFWRIMAFVYDEPTPETVEEKNDFLLRNGIALWDVVAECTIEGASDASITDVRPNDLSEILNTAAIEAIFTTGTKATQLYRRLCKPANGIPCTALPSPIPANARMSFDELWDIYSKALSPYQDTTPYPMLDVNEVVDLEQAIAQSGTSLHTLMHRAGRFLGYYATQLAALYAPTPHKDDPYRAAIFCGHGNNGGDGWVAADYLAQAGWQVDIICTGAPHTIKAEPARTTACELEDDLTRNPNVRILENPTDAELAVATSKAQVLIDALLGTGFSDETVREPFATWIKTINGAKEHGAYVIAADVPSGFSAQHGTPAQPCIQADATITMLTYKTGFAAEDADFYCGMIKVAPLAYNDTFWARRHSKDQ